MIAGDWLRAEELVMETFQLGNDSGQPDAIVFFALQSMATNFQEGTLVESIPLVEQMAGEVDVNLYLIKQGWLLFWPRMIERKRCGSCWRNFRRQASTSFSNAPGPSGCADSPKAPLR